MQKLAIFPLKLVLFPEAVLPLHIFEERYKNLINDTLENSLPFGINYLSESQMYPIGCAATIFNVLEEYSDGKMDITVSGIHRYKIKSFEQSDKLYNIAEIELIEDEEEELDLSILEQCLHYYNQIADMIKSLSIKKLDLSSLETTIPSFQIAQKAGLSLKQKQELLEMRSENKRLIFLKRHLSEILPMLKDANYVVQIIRNDGYFSKDILNRGESENE